MEFCYLLVPFAVPDLSHRLVEAMSNDILLLTTKKKKNSCMFISFFMVLYVQQFPHYAKIIIFVSTSIPL